MKDTSKPESGPRRPRRLRNAAPLLLSGLALFAATTGAATALPGKDTVNSGDIVNESVKSKDLGPGSVSSSEIGDQIHAHQNPVEVPGGGNENGAYIVRDAAVTCGGGEELISGSAHWSGEGLNEELFVSEVQLDHASETVTVKGGNDTANDRTLVAVAHCI